MPSVKELCARDKLTFKLHDPNVSLSEKELAQELAASFFQQIRERFPELTDEELKADLRRADPWTCEPLSLLKSFKKPVSKLAPALLAPAG